MTTYTIRVSQRVYYDVEVEAPSELEALRLVDRSINDPSASAPDFSDWLSSERDSDDFEIDAVQVDPDGGDYYHLHDRYGADWAKAPTPARGEV